MGFVYAFETVPGYVKVGRASNNWRSRVNNVNGYFPKDPTLCGVWQVEDDVKAEIEAHGLFRDASIQGKKELFHVAPKVAFGRLMSKFGEDNCVARGPQFVSKKNRRGKYWEHNLNTGERALQHFRELLTDAGLHSLLKDKTIEHALYTARSRDMYSWFAKEGMLRLCQQACAVLRREFDVLRDNDELSAHARRVYSAHVKRLRAWCRYPFETLVKGVQFTVSYRMHVRRSDFELFQSEMVVSGYWKRENWLAVFRFEHYGNGDAERMHHAHMREDRRYWRKLP